MGQAINSLSAWLCKCSSLLRNFFLFGPTYYTNGALKNGWEPSGGYAILSQFSDCELSWAQEHLSVPLINFLNKTPVLMVLGAEVLYTLWLPLAVLCVNLAHRKKVFIPMAMPFLFTYLTMLMLPAYQTRYSISFLFCFIFLIAFAFPVNKNPFVRILFWSFQSLKFSIYSGRHQYLFCCPVFLFYIQFQLLTRLKWLRYLGSKLCFGNHGLDFSGIAYHLFLYFALFWRSLRSECLRSFVLYCNAWYAWRVSS